jgi:5-formyltetrahydrofolate cyclo-ligase
VSILVEDRPRLRARLRAQRRSVPLAGRTAAASAAARIVARTHWLAPGRRIALYLPMPEEFDSLPLVDLALRRGCEVLVPRVDPSRSGRMRLHRLEGRLIANRYGIPEPASGSPVEARWAHVVFTPLVGFDRTGARLGMGAGYYDRLLAFRRLRQAWRGPRLVGLAYHFQELDHLPLRPHDIPLDWVVTERGLIDCTGGAP